MTFPRVLLIAASIFTCANTASAQTTCSLPSVSYDPSTGGIFFSNVIDVVGLRIDGPTSGNAPTNLGGAASGPFGLLNPQPNFVEWGNLTGMTFLEERFAGNVLPAGLFPFELASDYTVRFRTLADPAVDVLLSPRIVSLDPPECIPEPSTITIALFSLLGLATQRHRS